MDIETMTRRLVNAVRFTGLSDADAQRIASGFVATLAGAYSSRGSIPVADLTTLASHLAECAAGELQTPVEWSRRYGVYIMDPDGWRGGTTVGRHLPPRPFTDPITEAEFRLRLAESATG